VRALLATGADVNAKDDDQEGNGWTALDKATAGGHPDVKALLVQAGAPCCDRINPSPSRQNRHKNP
jgi:ankyrin repeat protein